MCPRPLLACPGGLRGWKLRSFQLRLSVETLGHVSVLLKIKFHLLPVVQELGPGLRGLWHWQQPPEQVELLGWREELLGAVGSAGERTPLAD